MAGLAIITEACIDVKDRACVDVCPVQCIYEFDPQKNVLFAEDEAGSGITENTHSPNPDAIGVFADSILYVNLEECTSCTTFYQPDVCSVGAIYSEEQIPDGSPTSAKLTRRIPTRVTTTPCSSGSASTQAHSAGAASRARAKGGCHGGLPPSSDPIACDQWGSWPAPCRSDASARTVDEQVPTCSFSFELPGR